MGDITLNPNHTHCLSSDAFSRKVWQECPAGDESTLRIVHPQGEACWCAGRTDSGLSNPADKVTLSKRTPFPRGNAEMHEGIAGVNPQPPHTARLTGARSTWLRKKEPQRSTAPRHRNEVNLWLGYCDTASTRPDSGTLAGITRARHRCRGSAYVDQRPPARNTETSCLSRHGEQGQPGWGMGAGPATKLTPPSNRADTQNSQGAVAILWEGGIA